MHSLQTELEASTSAPDEATLKHLTAVVTVASNLLAPTRLSGSTPLLPAHPHSPLPQSSNMNTCAYRSLEAPDDFLDDVPLPRLLFQNIGWALECSPKTPNLAGFLQATLSCLSACISNPIGITAKSPSER